MPTCSTPHAGIQENSAVRRRVDFEIARNAILVLKIGTGNSWSATGPERSGPFVSRKDLETIPPPRTIDELRLNDVEGGTFIVAALKPGTAMVGIQGQENP